MECQNQLRLAEQKLALSENICIDIETDKVGHLYGKEGIDKVFVIICFYLALQAM